MATGKSTVARVLHTATGHPFIDLDERVEARAGKSIPEIFKTDGEQTFRSLERMELAAILDQPQSPAPIVALGGGALVDRATRLNALDRAVVVTLEAPLQDIVKRAGRHNTRPLLSGPNPEARVVELLELRAKAYAESHARISTKDRSPQALAEQIKAIWARDPLAVAAGENSYSVLIGTDLVDTELAPLVAGSSTGLVVSDTTVYGLHGARIRAALERSGIPLSEALLTPGEEHKRIAAVDSIWRIALANSTDRKSIFVGLGGGVVTDITGFAAACWMRGVRWVGVPTTLLAMVDASVGGKTGVDLETAKNAVGAFWQPSAVICDVSLLATETQRNFTSALAEVVKTALIGDAELFELLESQAAAVRARQPEIVAEIVRRSIRVKARIVSFDERESGLRALLNLGHTVGHALESQAGYTRLTHGEAVSLGLVAALRIGERLGLTDAALSERTLRLLHALDLPTDLQSEPVVEAAELIGHDKKRAGKHVRFIFARGVGDVDSVNVELEALRAHTRSLNV
jgi:shikimate kinase/3-dehydroquinate synthase